MQLQTILNRVERYKSFVYGRASWDEQAGTPTLQVEVVPRANGRPICSGCHQKRPGYDRLSPRTFEFVPLWGIRVLFLYAMRRVSCPECGVTVEQVPWGDGKCQQTTSYRWFLARWARRLSWKEVASIFHSSWDTVYRSVHHAVLWGLANRDESGVTALGIDEIAWQKGHRYLTLVYQIDAGMKRLLWIGMERKEKTLQEFFDLLGTTITPTLKFVCSDMWKPYLETIRERAGDAVHVLDRYHLMAKMNRAIDDIRAAEAKQLKRDGHEQILKHSRWCLPKRPENLTEKQTVKMSELLKYNLKSVRAHLMREDFQRFWLYRSPGWARKFLREWCIRTMRSQLEPMKKMARSLREHEDLLINWFHAKREILSGTVERFNNKAQLTMKHSYGFRSDEVARRALYHALGALPEPQSTHRLC